MDTLSRDSDKPNLMKLLLLGGAAVLAVLVVMLLANIIFGRPTESRSHLYTVTQYSATGTVLNRWEHSKVVSWTGNCFIRRDDGSTIVVTPPYTIVEEAAQP